jgi:hypothetical protein
MQWYRLPFERVHLLGDVLQRCAAETVLREPDARRFNDLAVLHFRSITGERMARGLAASLTARTRVSLQSR